MTNRIITKALAGLEDLLLGTGEVTQVRGGANKQIKKIDAAGLIYENAETLRTRLGKKVEVLTNIAALQALATTTAAETFVYLLGYTTAGDGGGGLFWLDSSDTTTTEDLNIVFNPDVLANGRWKRVDTSKYMSADRGDNHYTVQVFDYGIQLFSTLFTVNRILTLPFGGDLYLGKRITVIRTIAGSYNLYIKLNTGVTVAILSGTGLIEVEWNGFSWVILSEPTSFSSEDDSFNGSFEIDSNNNNLPDNWAINELTSATIEIDKTDQAHGINSLKFLSGGSGGGTATSERFNVLSGSILPIQFTYKASAVDVLTKVDIQTYDKDGNTLSLLSAYSEAAANPTSFKSLNVSVVIDATAVTAEIVLTGIDTTSTTKTAGTTTHLDNIIIGGNAVRGCLANTTGENIANNTVVLLAFDAVDTYDTDLIHDIVTNNSRLIVPIGINFIRLSCHIEFSAGVAGSIMYVGFDKNGASAYPGATNMRYEYSPQDLHITLVSCIIPVIAGDYFETRVLHNSGATETTNAETWFSMEIVG